MRGGLLVLITWGWDNWEGWAGWKGWDDCIWVLLTVKLVTY